MPSRSRTALQIISRLICGELDGLVKLILSQATFNMDFASLMSAQIAKSSSPPKDSSTSAKRFQRRAEAERAREQAYLEDQAAREAERAAKAEKKRKHDEEEAERNQERELKRQRLAEDAKKVQVEEQKRAERERRKRIGLPELPPENEKNGERDGAPDIEGDDMPEDELVSRLREMQEPALLFGESHDERLKRFYRSVAKKSRTESLVKPGRPNQPIPTNLEPVDESDTAVPSEHVNGYDREARLLLARRLTTWFNLVLREWGLALAGRDEATKQSFSGQSATTSYTQALQHLRPLFRKLEQCPSNPETLPTDLLQPMTEIVHDAQQRRYVAANDGYLKLSIGKAAWPIGVTMVGIHERSAREKLHGGDAGKAHIMSDESTRKILQSIKRCLSFAQTRWPPEDLGQLMG